MVALGGKLVWRRGCEDVDVVDSMEALRRFVEGPLGMSDCRRLSGWGRGECEGYGGEIAESEWW